jgi:Uncharacterised nucleotidyltransferase
VRGPCVADLSPTALEGALYRTTERLAAELASPTPAAPEWTQSEWLMARAVAAIHGITPILGLVLPWEGPEGWNEFLRKESVRELRRRRRIGELLRLVDEQLRAVEVPAVALKGAALYDAGLYGQGERPMADVDVLVRRCHLKRTSQALEALGFQESLRTWKNREFSAGEGGALWLPQEPGEDPIKIDLHERICEMLPARIVDISRFMFPDELSPGLNRYASRASLIAHLVLHAAGAIVERALRLIQLHDIALLAAVARDEDWAEVLRIGESRRAPWWAFPPLALTDRYYPGRIPRWVLNSAGSSCPAILSRISARQRLSDVSLSFPWVQAFPGIAWARSPTEALEYIVKRVVSDGEQVSMRARAVKSVPGLSASERRWLAVSQGERIVRWLVSHPARSLTMRAVRSAFGESR